MGGGGAVSKAIRMANFRFLYMLLTSKGKISECANVLLNRFN